MENGHILYPCYFDASIQRRCGRRVPQSLASVRPTVNDIESALKEMHVSYERQDAPHPAFWWKHDGRVVVTFEGSKNELIRAVAANLNVTPVRIHGRKR